MKVDGATTDRPAVLFDLDGTLLDSNFHHVVALHRAFLDIGEEVPCRRILGLIGRSGSELVQALLGDDLADKQARTSKRSTPSTSSKPHRRSDDFRERANCWRSWPNSAGGQCSPHRPDPTSWRCCAMRSTSNRARPSSWVTRCGTCTPVAAPGLPTAGVLSGGIPREALEQAGAAVSAGPLEVGAHLEDFSQLLRR